MCGGAGTDDGEAIALRTVCVCVCVCVDELNGVEWNGMVLFCLFFLLSHLLLIY